MRNATWDGVDNGQRMWSILAGRTKTGRCYRVPLSDAAVFVLDEAHERTVGLGADLPVVRGKVQSGEGFGQTPQIKQHRLFAL